MAALRAHLETARSISDGRGAPRRKLNLAVQGTTSAGTTTNVLVHNLSATGLLIETAADLAMGEAFEVDMPNAGAISAVVMWNSDRLFGCKFVAPLPNAAISAALLRTPAERSPVPSPEVGPPRQAADHLNDAATQSRPKLALRTRALIIAGFCLAAWTLIIAAIARIV